MIPKVLIFILRAAYNNVIKGLIQLKIAYIKYSPTLTPNTDEWYAPQEFHGINAEVTVAESSRVLLRFSGAKSLSLKASSNILPETTIDKYWSEALTLRAKHEATVLANNLKVVSAHFNNALLIVFKAPIASITPPNTIVPITKKIVFIIPSIPPVENKSFNITLFVSILISPVMVSIITMYESTILEFVPPDNSLIICGWKINENNAPARVPITRAINGGVFLTIIISTIRGTIKRTNDILNFSDIAFNKYVLSVVPSETWRNPRIIKTINVIEILGIVVYVKYFMCLKRSTLVTAAARLVVSLNGESLSPK